MGATKSDDSGAEDDLDEGEDEPVPRSATPGGNDDEEENIEVKVAVVSVLDGVDSVLGRVDWVLDGVASVLDGVMLLLVIVADGVIDTPLSELLEIIDAG